MKPTQAQVEKYVATLDHSIQHVHLVAYNRVLMEADTLSEEFQIAASILDLFSARTAQWLNIQNDACFACGHDRTQP